MTPDVRRAFSFDRYQNFEGITQVGNTYDTPQIRILHVPSLDFDTVEQSLHGTPAALERRWFGSRAEPQ